MKQTRANDVRAAARAKRHGMHHTLKIAQEARKEGIPYDLAYALVEQETGTARNVFGHDPVAAIPVTWRGAKVTKSRYLAYKAARKRGLGMQGVGPLQLTWWATQDSADREGGCWRPRYNIRIGFRTLRAQIRIHDSLHRGVAAYNGSGDAAERYARSVLGRRAKWHQILNP